MAENVQSQDQGSVPAVPQQKEGKQTWGEYGKQVYNEQYERWMPWIEDMYLRLFTRDNKASYATKGTSWSPAVRAFSARHTCLPAYLPRPRDRPRGG